MCPCCQNIFPDIIKRGFFMGLSVLDGSRTSRIQKYYCKTCRSNFSDQTFRSTYRDHKPQLNEQVFKLIVSGVSQRQIGRFISVHQDTVAAKLLRVSRACAEFSRVQRARLSRDFSSVVVFDEMETFEHSKLKPLSIAVAVEEKTRYIYSCLVAEMPSKGRLYKRSIKKYGARTDMRKHSLGELLRVVRTSVPHVKTLKSDKCPRYPYLVRKFIPAASHETFKGRRGCVVGQGELKAGGRDPLFSLNHSCAMVRDNLKRMSRRTWCTTKRSDRLQALLNIYIYSHNERLKVKSRLPNLPVEEKWTGAVQNALSNWRYEMKKSETRIVTREMTTA